MAGRDEGHDAGVGDPQAAHAVDLEARVDDGGRVAGRTHFAGAAQVVNGVGHVHRLAAPVVVAHEDVVAAAGYGDAVELGAELAHGARVGDRDGRLDAAHHRLEVLGDGEVVGPDDGLVERVGGAQPEAAAAARPHDHREDGPRVGVLERLVDGVPQLVAEAEGGLVERIADVRAADEQQLDVGVVVAAGRVGARLQEGDGLGVGNGQRSAMVVGECNHRLQVEHALELEGDALVDGEYDAADRLVVLQVVAHAQILHDRYAQLLQMALGPDAAQHQNLRRVGRAGRQHHLLARPHHVPFVVARELDRPRALGFRVDQHFGHLGELLDVQIAPMADRVQERLGGAEAAAVAHRRLDVREAHLLGRVVVVDRVAQLLARFEEGPGERRAVRVAGNGEVAAGRVVLGVGRVLGDPHVLRLFKVRQHLLVTPARVAQLGPQVVILFIATRLDHAVQHAAAAHHLACNIR